MNEFDEVCLEYFLAHQEQLLPEPVAERGKSLFRRSGG